MTSTSTDFDGSTPAHRLPPVGSRRPNSTSYHDIAIKVTKGLAQFGPSVDPDKLLVFLKTIPLNRRTPIPCESLWHADFPSTWLNLVLDQAWNDLFAVGAPIGGHELSNEAHSEQLASSLELLQMTIVLFWNLLSSAEDYVDDETLAPKIRLFIQHLPPLFGLLWEHRHIVLRIQTSQQESTSSSESASIFTAIQRLLVSYYTLYESVLPESPVPPFTFVVHISIYCWYYSSDNDRKTFGLPCWLSPILDNMTESDPEWCRSFATEVIYPVMGPSPTKAISRLLKKDRGLTNAALLEITIDFLTVLIALCPFIAQDVQDAKELMMAMATAAQRLHCCDPGLDDDDLTASVALSSAERNLQISTGMLCIIQHLCRQIGADKLQQIIVSCPNYLHFLPQIAHCIIPVLKETKVLARETVMFLITTYRIIGDSAQRGRLTAAKLANYKQFQRVFQVYWPLILDEVRSQSSRGTYQPPELNGGTLRTFRIQWESLGRILNGVPTGNMWNEREMLGCFNVECLCYGQKPLHKLRECKHCQTAHYCNKECQRKDWVARHRSICGRS